MATSVVTFILSEQIQTFGRLHPERSQLYAFMPLFIGPVWFASILTAIVADLLFHEDQKIRQKINDFSLKYLMIVLSFLFIMNLFQEKSLGAAFDNLLMQMYSIAISAIFGFLGILVFFEPENLSTIVFILPFLLILFISYWLLKKNQNAPT